MVVFMIEMIYSMNNNTYNDGVNKNNDSAVHKNNVTWNNT
jgi:hypothetical protein